MWVQLLPHSKQVEGAALITVQVSCIILRAECLPQNPDNPGHVRTVKFLQGAADRLMFSQWSASNIEKMYKDPAPAKNNKSSALRAGLFRVRF